MSDGLRLLVLAEDPTMAVSAVEARFAGLQITTVADFAMLGAAIASDSSRVPFRATSCSARRR